MVLCLGPTARLYRYGGNVSINVRKRWKDYLKKRIAYSLANYYVGNIYEVALKIESNLHLQQKLR